MFLKLAMGSGCHRSILKSKMTVINILRSSSLNSVKVYKQNYNNTVDRCKNGPSIVVSHFNAYCIMFCFVCRILRTHHLVVFTELTNNLVYKVHKAEFSCFSALYIIIIYRWEIPWEIWMNNDFKFPLKLAQNWP